MDSLLDSSTVLLFVANIAQMSVIACLLFPITDIVTLSKLIKQYTGNLASNHLFVTVAMIYFMAIGGYGIYNPMQTLSKFKMPRYVRLNLSPTERLKNIIESINATRNYMLACFSLFFVLVTWRLFEFIVFSAKLYEFSDLMGNYNLVDIAFTEIDADESYKRVVDESFDDTVSDEAVQWPLVVKLNEKEYLRLKGFLDEMPNVSEFTKTDSITVFADTLLTENIEWKKEKDPEDNVEEPEQSKTTTKDKRKDPTPDK